MKKYILILVVFFMFIIYYFNGIYMADNRIKELSNLLREHKISVIDSLFYEHSKIYIEDLEGQVKFEGNYAEVKEELKKYLSNENMHISLSVLDYSIKHNLYSITVKNPLFFQDKLNKTYGELEYKIEFINMPFISKIIKISVSRV